MNKRPTRDSVEKRKLWQINQPHHNKVAVKAQLNNKAEPPAGHRSSKVQMLQSRNKAQSQSSETGLPSNP
jgi:hypothetical protein